MEQEIEKLKMEIKILNKRISILEHREAKRRFFKVLKIIFDIIVLGIIAYAIWYGYNYITNIPDLIKDALSNAFR